MQEQKLYTIEDYRALQDTPAEPFKADLRMMCRAAFGPDWTDQHPGQAAIDRLRGYGFLPEVFIGMYEVMGGEERFRQLGFLPVEQLKPKPFTFNKQPGECLTYRCHEKDDVEYAFSPMIVSREYSPERHCEPFHGVFYTIGVSYNELDGKYSEKIWSQYHDFGGWWRKKNTLAAVLLYQIGEALAGWMPNQAWLKIPVKKEGKLSWYQTLAKRLDCITLQSIEPLGLEFVCDPDRGVLVLYDSQSHFKVMAYSREPAQLARLEEKYPLAWQRQEGKRVLDPAKFIHSPTPAAFAEKLEAMSRALLGKRSMALPMEEISKAEARLGFQLPEALRQFYLRFGKGGKLFTSESMNDILTFQQMDPEDDDFGEDFAEALEQGSLLLAIENQGVWTMYLDLKTGEPWLDWGEGRQDCWGLDLEGALLYLLAMNATGFLPWGGECDMEDTPENRELLGHYFHFILDGPMAVFADPDKGLVGFRSGETQICIMARSQKALNDLERDINIMVSMF